MESRRTPSDASYNVWFGLILLAAAGVLAGGAVLAYLHPDKTFLLSDGIFATLIVGVTWLLSSGMSTWKRSAEAERANALKSVDARLSHLSDLLTTMGQQMLLSDRAKGIAYRSKDRQALRDAIREEMNAKDWDAALVLANDMEREFGYVQEAAALRAEINNNRAEVVRRQVGEAIAAVDQFVAAEQWTHAVREAERVMQVFPNDAQVQQLPQLIEARRQQHKKGLRDAMDAAAGRRDYDAAFEILRRLDPYLTPAEAGGMQEMVRGLLKDRLNSIRDQVKAAAHAGNLDEVVRLGEIVRAEHPNSRLAIEIPDLIDGMRHKTGNRNPAQFQPA